MTQQPALGRAIRDARERLHMTQADLAERVGTSKRTVDNWENGRTHPKNRLGALEDALGTSLRKPDAMPSTNPTDDELDQMIAEARQDRARGDDALYELLMSVWRLRHAQPRDTSGDTDQASDTA